MRRIAESSRSPDEMTFENREVADEFEKSLRRRIRWWKAKAREVQARRTATVAAAVQDAVEINGEAPGSPGNPRTNGDREPPRDQSVRLPSRDHNRACAERRPYPDADAG